MGPWSRFQIAQPTTLLTLVQTIAAIHGPTESAGHYEKCSRNDILPPQRPIKMEATGNGGKRKVLYLLCIFT